MRAIPPLLLLLLAACGSRSDEQALAERLPGEAQAVGDAEAMIAEHADRAVRVGADEEGEERDEP